jgi:DNA-binding GntR family transcriptional regulator
VNALSTVPLSSVVHEALREDIVLGKVSPGSMITEASVTERYGVSRPTAKAAVERLVAEGLLLRVANRAARVPRLGITDIVDLYDSRLIIEAAVMRRLARRMRVPEEAAAAHAELLAHSEDGDETNFTKADIAFHRALVAASASPRLIRMHSIVLGETELCMGQIRTMRVMDPVLVAEEHQGLMNAIESGDVELTAELTRNHLEGTRDRLVEARLRAAPITDRH